jgi:hypothetical protein
MDRALWLLLWLRLWAGVRRLGRTLATVRGALLTAFGLLIVGCWVSSLLLTPRPETATDPELVRRVGALGLLGYCLLILVTSAGEKAVSFSPAEVNLLFPGPFSRRQLLAYKIVTAWLTSLATALILTLALRMHTHWAVAAFAGVLLAVMFMQLFAMLIALVGSTVGAQAFDLRRKLLVLGIVAALVVLALLTLDREAFTLPPLELLQRAEEGPVVQTLLAPLGWFMDAFTAERLWPDLVEAVLLSLMVNGVLLALVFLLDARYLETAAAVSERVYARLQQMRSGGSATPVFRGSGKASFGLPDLPWWGGIGPIAWRQLLAALRALKSLTLFLGVFAIVLVGMLVFLRRSQPPDKTLSYTLASSALFFTLFLQQIFRFDFRGDVDRMEVLKSLPVAPARLVVGQLLAPVLLTCAIQLILLLIIQVLLGGLGPLVLGAALFALPVNFLLFEIVNLLFLWFPTRLVQSTPGDFQMVGRHMLLMFATLLCQALLVGVPALMATAVYFVSGGSWPAALATAWLLLAAITAALIPLIALAFRQFDVARDTPP